MRRWGPTVCLDCRATDPAPCETCTLAITALGEREKRNAYHRAYRKQMMTHPIQGPRIREQARIRMKRYRERKQDK